MKLYGAPRTRALRVAWLLEELDLPYQLELVNFQPTKSTFFIQRTPTGKIPTLDDDGVVICESGAIVEYVLEKYGGGRLMPAQGSPERAQYLQWLHFSESTAFAPLGVVVWLVNYRDDAAEHPALVEDAIGRARQTLSFVNEHMKGRAFLAGTEFTAADVMMGFTLLAAKLLNVLHGFDALNEYLDRLLARPPAQTALRRLQMV